jgi:CRISPR-associated endonuclease Csn1
LQDYSAKFKNRCAHISGSLHIEGVPSLHPLVSFDGEAADWRGAPLAVTGEPPQPILAALISLGFAPFDLSPHLKPLYHACAVLASGHIATLFAAATEILKSSGIALPGNGLAPLAQTAINNAAKHGREGITGPFARGDRDTIQRDLNVLPEEWRGVFEGVGEMGKQPAFAAGSQRTENKRKRVPIKEPKNPSREGCPSKGQCLQTQEMSLYCDTQKAPVQVHSDNVSKEGLERKMKNENNFPGQVAYKVGLDLGCSSIGWCVIQCAWDDSGQRWRPNGIEGLGVRIFTAGTEGDIEKGRDESRGIKRRMARGARRNLARRAGRMHGLYLALVKAGLLPEPPDLNKGPLAPIIDRSLKELDLELIRMGGDASKLPYDLRAKALDNQLKPFELGRVFYHLAQRRGFKSNKRADARTDGEERGKVKEGIRRQQEKMGEKGARTIGEMLCKEDPEIERIRARYNSRDMIEHEFNAIWEKQKEFHPKLLTEGLRSNLHEHIFFQRPLKSVDHLVGYCSLEQGRWVKVLRRKRRDGRKFDEPKQMRVYKAPRRLALADPLAQRVRLLQRLNDLKINHADGTSSPLSLEQRSELLAKMQNGDVAFKEVKKLLKLGKEDSLNLESGQKSLVGNRTAGKMRAVLGDAWDSYSELDKSKLVYLLVKAQSTDELVTKLKTEWGFDMDRAAQLADADLEDGYLSFSRTACEKLLPGLEAGRSLNTIREELYGASKPSEPLDSLPIVTQAFPDLRNPVVSRVLTELRKVVKAIIRKWGLPQSFTLELARELKNSRETRKVITKNIEERTNERDKARNILIDRGLVVKPKARDVEKYLLWEECGGIEAKCPYTGKIISLTDLFSTNSPWDIEHIIPYSRSLNDSFANKTLCWEKFNRNEKHNKLPMELSPAKIEEILNRVQAWPNSATKAKKLRRFRQTEVDQNFISSQLNDTAYATRLACDYLALLYGGRSDNQGQHIFASKGQATAQLRGVWKMNELLGGREKNRGDHRHHAIDALVIALSTHEILKTLAYASKNPTDINRVKFSKIPPPWDNFIGGVEQSLGQVIISRQLKRKLSGRLHEETNYGAIDEKIKTSRVAVEALTKKQIADIVNPVIKDRVLAQLEALGKDDPKQAFKDRKDHPYLQAKDGRHIPIHKVKLAYNQSTVEVGAEFRKRNVIPDSNHHMAVYEVQDSKGRTKWDYEVVSLLDATMRHSQGLPVVDKKPGFVMTLSAGDTVMYEQEGKKIQAWVRTVVSDGRVGLVVHTDARKKEEQKKDGAFKEFAINTLRELHCVKTQIDPVGEIRVCRD